MSKEEIVNKIRDEVKAIESLFPLEPYLVEESMEEIIKLINQLVQITPESQLNKHGSSEKANYISIIYSLGHTKDKEGISLIYDYDEYMKKETSQAKRQKFHKTFTDLIKRIKRETNSIGNM